MAEKMKVVVYRDKHDVVFTDRDIPKVIDPRDAIVKVGMSSICTSDFTLHGTIPKAKKESSWGMNLQVKLLKSVRPLKNQAR